MLDKFVSDLMQKVPYSLNDFKFNFLFWINLDLKKSNSKNLSFASNSLSTSTTDLDLFRTFFTGKTMTTRKIKHIFHLFLAVSTILALFLNENDSLLFLISIFDFPQLTWELEISGSNFEYHSWMYFPLNFWFYPCSISCPQIFNVPIHSWKRYTTV